MPVDWSAGMPSENVAEPVMVTLVPSDDRVNAASVKFRVMALLLPKLMKGLVW